MRVSAVAAVAGVVLLTPSVAGAAAQPATSKKVASGSASVASCGTLSGITVSWTSRAGVVTKVVLGSIPAACTGGSLWLTLVDSGDSALGTAGPVTVTGTSLTISAVSGSPAAASVVRARIAVVGP